MSAQVIAWDVLDGDVLGAVIRCPECPCHCGTGCDGTGQLFRPYRLPGGAQIDLYRDADILLKVLDREGATPTEAPMSGENRVKASDSPRWCETCRTWGDHHTDRHPVADTNPLRDELYDMLHLCLGVDDADDLAVDHCNDTTASVLEVLAEFIGDGLLDANGQRVKLVEVPDALIPASYEIDSEGDRLIIHKRADVPLFVLERSEDTP